MTDDAFLLDRYGSRIYVGDYVRAEVDHYKSVRRGEQRRVYGIEDGCIVLHNDQRRWPHQTSPFRSYNFKLAGRHHPWHKQQDNPVAKIAIYIAIRTDGDNFQQMADRIDSFKPMHDLGMSALIMSETSLNLLKERLTKRIQDHPEETWLITTATTLAEIAGPPVRFRDAL